MRALLQAFWRWFDDLTGLTGVLGPLARHPVPRTGRVVSWMYVFGSATLFVFVIQVVTGTVLASGYVASSGDAYDSLLFISSTTLGRLIRGIHSFGASAMIILVGIHAIQVYLAAAYKYPRQISWLSGTGLLFLTLGMAFTGQLLRWDQTGFWTVVIAAEQAGRMPLVGNWLGHFILAGATVGGATLSRFFATHVFFIPALIFLFVGIHLYLVVHNGISEPPESGRPVEPGTYRSWYKTLVERGGVSFWPDAAWRDMVFGVFVVVAIVALAAIVGPPELGKPPDPTIIDASPRPDWYFLWYFAVLTLIPRWSENYVIVLGPLMLGLVMVLLPLLASRGERSPVRRPWSIVVVLSIVATIWYYSRIGELAPWSPRFAAQPLPAEAVGVTSGPVTDGAKLFFSKGCEYCHLVDGQGGIRGPDLSDVGSRLTSDQIITRIYSGATNMPSYVNTLSTSELRALVAFLETRRKLPSPPRPNPPTGPLSPRPADRVRQGPPRGF
jgi:ubiquinol-cytochrome c reductase cytochrome b subunit